MKNDSLPLSKKKILLEKIVSEIKECKKCPLHARRKNPVPGEGNPFSYIMLIGEAPGKEEDLEGRPFVGRAGALLDRLLQSNSISREEDVYITNLLKCRPPSNRDPRKEEIDQCKEFLERQIELIKPKIVCCLGRHAAQFILKKKASIEEVRGRIIKSEYASKTIITYHPAAALRDPSKIEKLDEDLKLLKVAFDRD